MGAHESIWTTLLALLASTAAPSPQDAGRSDPTELRWDARDPAHAARTLASARGGGAVAARSARADFEAAPVAERRLRARVLATESGPDEVPGLVPLAADADRVVRVEIARALGRPDLGTALSAERTAVLARLAAEDEDAEVRALSRSGLATLAAADALARIADAAPRGERAALLVELAGLPAARAAVQSRLSAEDEELVLAARLAAEGDPGSQEDAVLARIADGLARGSTTALAALERHARRLVQLGAEERALATLARFDDASIAELRARLALGNGGDPAIALASARALANARPAGESEVVASLRASRAERLATCARLVLGAEDDGAGLATARAALAARLARRADRGGAEASAEHVALLVEAGQVELCEAVRILRGSPAAVEHAVDAASAFHRLALLAQAAATRAELPAADGLDRFLGDDDSAVELVLDGEPSGALDAAARIDIRLALGRALATAAGPELVGFEPIGASDPARGARRRALLEDVLHADVERAQMRHSRAALAVERARVERPGGARAELQQEELESRLALQSAWEDLALLAGGDEKPLSDQRSASWFALTTARRLRDAGRGAESRALLGRARADLEASGAAQQWLWGIELLAEIEAAIGSSFTDDEEPRRAETELLRAVERLAALETLLRERGAPARAIDAVENQRANALVSLAVNANVRMGDPKRALEHFEAAWALRQDEFLRVLLAVYRARSGRAAEARAALATVAPGPGTYYNLACAWALLGERDVALRWLEKELRENHAPGGGLERQKAWARKDPDLASLRGDPRFTELVGG